MKTPSRQSSVPVSALCAESRIRDISLKIKNTPLGGDLLGIVKPTWIKAMESETRMTWLKTMIDRKLVVRDIESFGKNTTEKFRAESSRKEEIGRETLLELMKVKYIDEKRYYRECKRIREKIRDIVRETIGRRAYDRLIKKLKDNVELQKRKLEKKYASKTKAVLKRLCLEDMEHDVEICKAKLRYEKRRRDEIIREREIYETEYGEVSNNKRRKL